MRWKRVFISIMGISFIIIGFSIFSGNKWNHSLLSGDKNPIPSDFQATNDSLGIVFYKFPAQNYDPIQDPPAWGFDRRTYRSLLVFGVQTDNVSDTHVVNFDQAYFNASLRLPSINPVTESGPWNVSMRVRVVNYDSIAKDHAIEMGWRGYELFAGVKSMNDLGVVYHYSEHYNASNTLVFSISYVRMTTYLVIVDILVQPEATNDKIYSTGIADFSANMMYNFSGGLHYGLVPDVVGAAYLMNDLMPHEGSGDNGSVMVITLVVSAVAGACVAFLLIRHYKNQ